MALTLLAALAIFVMLAFFRASITSWVLAMMVVVPVLGRNRLIALGLAAMWGWTGIVYQWGYFAAINKAAPVFAALFVLQAALFLYFGVITEGVKFRASRGPRAWVGWALIAYAAVLYPLIGFRLGHSFEEVPMFGITPCPVTIFTLGLLLLAAPMPRGLLAIPFLWSLVGGSAAFLLGVPQDWVLLLAGIVALWMAFRPRAPA